MGLVVKRLETQGKCALGVAREVELLSAHNLRLNPGFGHTLRQC